MSFEQLLVELVRDENARLQINSTLGLDSENTSSDYASTETPSE
jgi:hypothetical protein